MKVPLLCARTAITNLKREPLDPCPGSGADNLQESQLLYNELFLPFKEEGDWYYGEAVEQPYHTQRGWTGYPGWAKKSALAGVESVEPNNAVIIGHETEIFSEPLCSGQVMATLPLGSRVRLDHAPGTKPGFSSVFLHSGQTGLVRNDSLRAFEDQGMGPLHENVIREVIDNAFLFLGTPYLWGGMSLSGSPSAGTSSGVDCSALVYLSYRLSGIEVPRNAHDQWIFAQSVEGNHLRPGDLVFIAREESPDLVRHVMICTGPESVIEASETGRTVSETTFTEKFGLSLSGLKRAGFVVPGKKIYFGRIIKGLNVEPLYDV